MCVCVCVEIIYFLGFSFQLWVDLKEEKKRKPDNSVQRTLDLFSGWRLPSSLEMKRGGKYAFVRCRLDFPLLQHPFPTCTLAKA